MGGAIERVVLVNSSFRTLANCYSDAYVLGHGERAYDKELRSRFRMICFTHLVKLYMDWMGNDRCLARNKRKLVSVNKTIKKLVVPICLKGVGSAIICQFSYFHLLSVNVKEVSLLLGTI